MRAVIFPGQASHRPGMASAWDGHPAVTTFDEVGRACGVRDLRRIADDPEACASTAVGQPAIFAASIAAWRALDDAGVSADLVAGHSLGEVTAATAAGVLSLAEGADLVGERGRAFAAACRATPGAMAAVLGLDRAAVDEVVSEVPDVVVANDNAPGQVVIAGDTGAVADAAERCREVGGRVRTLDVEGAFHTAAMTPAIVRVASALRRLAPRDPLVPVLSASTLRLEVTAEGVARSLIDGVLATVRWREAQGRLAELGVTTIVEAGPGGVLRGLARRTIPSLEVVAVDGPEALDQLVEEEVVAR